MDITSLSNLLDRASPYFDVGELVIDLCPIWSSKPILITYENLQYSTVLMPEGGII